MPKPTNGKPKPKGKPTTTTPAKPKRAKKQTAPDLLNYDQAGDLLNCCGATVRRMVDLGQLPSLSVSPSGKHRMIRRVDVDDYIRCAVETRRPPEVARPLESDRRERFLRAGWDGIERT